jgi:hypothetical protein
MTTETPSMERTRMIVLWIGILGTFLIMAAMVGLMYARTRPPAVNAARAEERRKALADVTAQSRDQLENYAWIDPTKGIVRLPVSQAMELTVRNWKSPAAARSNLIARLPKVAPPAPNPYE